MRIGQEQSGLREPPSLQSVACPTSAYTGGLPIRSNIDCPRTIARWRVLTVLHHAGNQKLIDLSIHTSIGPSTPSRLTEGMQRRRLVARSMLRLMYQRIVEFRKSSL